MGSETESSPATTIVAPLDASDASPSNPGIPMRSAGRLSRLQGFHGSLQSLSTKTIEWTRTFAKFVGPGYMVAVGYLDPGNWATDLSAGSQVSFQ
jgi:hypothetical protein